MNAGKPPGIRIFISRCERCGIRRLNLTPVQLASGRTETSAKNQYSNGSRPKGRHLVNTQYLRSLRRRDKRTTWGGLTGTRLAIYIRSPDRGA